jgi:HK97 family phage major capsid protein
MNKNIILRKVGGVLAALFGGGTALAAGPAPTRHAGPLAAVGAFLSVILLPLLALALVALLFAGDVHGAFSLAFPAAVAMPPLSGEMKKKQEDLVKILGELEAGQKEMSAGNITQARGEELEAKAKEAEKLQGEIDQFKRISGLTGRAREVAEAILPQGERKGQEDPDGVAGYLSLGEAFTSSAEFKRLREQGMGEGTPGIIVQFNGAELHRKSGPGLIAITHKQLEQKAITVGASVIRVDRDPEVVRSNTEQDRIYIRDLVNVSRTDSSSVEYIAFTLTRAAAPVAESGTKPEAGIALTRATAPVRTLAVRTPVTEQQLQDVADIQNIIDNELTWDLKKVEEQQIIWGAGTGENLLGLMAAGSGVAAGRTVGGDTFIDLAKRMATDIVVAGGEPNGVVVDPLDWESIVLAKGTDNRYVWVVITDAQGNPRLWGMRVVETVAAREPGTYTTNERRMIVGDWRRGATLWDRQQANTAIGWVNDQFIKNERTVRVEERVAFGIKRAHFFRYRITQARVV